MANSINPVLHTRFDHRNMVFLTCPNIEGNYDIIIIYLIHESFCACLIFFINNNY